LVTIGEVVDPKLHSPLLAVVELRTSELADDAKKEAKEKH